MMACFLGHEKLLLDLSPGNNTQHRGMFYGCCLIGKAIHMQAQLNVLINYSTFFTMFARVSISALAGVASVSFVAVPAVQTRRGVADRLGLY